jgi:hypothetical protein
MAAYMDLKGTQNPSFMIGLNGSKLLSDGIRLSLKNKAETVFQDFEAKDIYANAAYLAQLNVTGNSFNLNSDATSAGFDWVMTFSRPTAGMSANVNYTFPAAPINGYFLTTDGAGNLSWATISTPSVTEKVSVDYAPLTSSTPTGPSTIFSLPANSIVLKVEVLVDSAFDGAPTVNISGSLSGILMGTAFSDLSENQTKFVVEPLALAQLSSQDITFNFNAGGATVGAARILVHHVIPAP